MSCSQEFVIFGANVVEVHRTQTWRGHMTSFWEVFPCPWSKQHVHSFLSQNSFGQVVHNHHLKEKEKEKETENPTQIGHHM